MPLSNKYKRGYLEFKKKFAAGDSNLMGRLAQGQQPDCLVVSCVDSRVDPALILGAQPGELLIVRNVANLVPDPDSDGRYSICAALEFGLCNLNIPKLILLGHSNCGGIQNRLGLAGLSQDECVSCWTDNIHLEQADMDVNQAAKASLLHSYQNCLSYPWLQQRVEQGTLVVELMFFDIASACLLQYNHQQQDFIEITEL